MLVRPDVATVQMEAEKKEPITGEGKVVLPGITASGSGGPAIAAPESPGTGAPQPVVLRRFHGSVKLDSIRIGRDASRIGEEVVQHLSGLVGANVDVTLEIQASIPGGAPEKTVRDVTENCRTLKFGSYGFEEN
jgi:hypothetical protein